MSRFQIFLIVLYLFFFGSIGGWVLELLFRRFFSGAIARVLHGVAFLPAQQLDDQGV